VGDQPEPRRSPEPGHVGQRLPAGEQDRVDVGGGQPGAQTRQPIGDDHGCCGHTARRILEAVAAFNRPPGRAWPHRLHLAVMDRSGAHGGRVRPRLAAPAAPGRAPTISRTARYHPRARVAMRREGGRAPGPGTRAPLQHRLHTLRPGRRRRCRTPGPRTLSPLQRCRAAKTTWPTLVLSALESFPSCRVHASTADQYRPGNGPQALEPFPTLAPAGRAGRGGRIPPATDLRPSNLFRLGKRASASSCGEGRGNLPRPSPPDGRSRCYHTGMRGAQAGRAFVSICARTSSALSNWPIRRYASCSAR